MSAHTKKHPTSGRREKAPKRARRRPWTLLTFKGPTDQATTARQHMQAIGFEEVTDTSDDTMPWREAFPQWADDAIPGVCLAGARHKEGLTQVHLAHLTGIPQRHISEMERGKRAIGKDRAKKLAEVLNVSYKILL